MAGYRDIYGSSADGFSLHARDYAVTPGVGHAPMLDEPVALDAVLSLLGQAD